MIPPSSRSFSLPSRPQAFLVGLMVAATFGAGGGLELFAQQSAPGAAPRRAESSARTSKQGSRAAATASNAAAKRVAQEGASGAATTGARGRSPAGERAAAAGVRQTSATVSADGGVVLAGGAMANADCRQCGRQDCGKCRPVGDRLGLHCNGLCEQGGCQAHCPVRPDQFGYYATRWRSWPGQGVKQVGHFDPATTPAVPPRSEVPGMEDELALPSQLDEAAPDEEEEEEEEAMADAEADAAGKADAAAGDAEAAAGADGASGSEGGLPDGAPLAPSASESEDAEAKSGDKDATPSNTPSKANGPRDVPLETSGAEAARPAGALTAGAWSNWSRASVADRKQAPPGSVVRTSGPAETTDVEGSDDRRDGSKLRSPAQRMVEGSERAVGRWRAKAAAPAEASGEAAANPLRGVTAQPGNPLR
jgi:hypothetical protein